MAKQKKKASPKYAKEDILWTPILTHLQYEVNLSGQIRKKIKRGYVNIKTYPKNSVKKGSPYLMVQLTDKTTGKRTAFKVAYLVAMAFLDPPPSPNHVLWHKNGDHFDNFANNLEWITRKKLGLKTGANSRRRPVRKVNKNGEIFAVYMSAREAGRNNYLSYQAVMDRCNNKVKNPFDSDGYTYEWDDNNDNYEEEFDYFQGGLEDERHSAACQ